MKSTPDDLPVPDGTELNTVISKKRLAELERTEAKMRALEATGVDNWEGYDIAMDRFRAKVGEKDGDSDL